jgi:hypothetical protein
MAKEERYLPHLNGELEALLPNQCQQCRLARRLILFSQGSNSLPTSETLKTADELKEKCTGYKKELEDYDIITGINSVARFREMTDNPACPYSSSVAAAR